ncbi:cadherin-like beta sandwich domain-containing protein, partial [Flavobacterium hydatis]
VNGDDETSLTTQPTVTTTATTSSSVGVYPIAISGATATNYTIGYTAGATLTVTQAGLIITADNETKVFGDVNPTLSVTYSGFVNGDTSASLTTQPTITTTAVTGSAVGTYPITASGAVDLNYLISYVTGILTVTASTSTSDADLVNLVISNGTLNPVFSPSITSYNVTVGNNVTVENITPTSEDPLATVTVNGIVVTRGTSSGAINLLPGQNTIVTQVTAADGVTIKTYTIIVTRAGSNNATLSDLSISNGDLTPVFASNITDYGAAVENQVSSITLTPTLTDPLATVAVNGVLVANGSSSAPINLNTGNNIITVVVTAQDGITKETYTVDVYRAVAPNEIVVTNVITPNGDGKNDFWEIKDILLYPNNTVTVYDRAGRVVYSKKTYTNNWDGSYQGNPLSNETYYYLVDLGPDLAKLKGFITIIRD